METKVNYATVGLFVVGLTTAFIAGVLVLSTGLTRTPYQDYIAYVDESVSGLNISAPVKYKGVDVGFVREIGLRPGNPEQVRILMAIERGTPVKTDTVAILSVQGLTGIAYIDLSGGSAEAPILETLPGDTHPIIRTGPSLLARLDQAASQMFTNIERVSDSITGLIGPDSKEAFQEAIMHIRDFTARMDRLLDDGNVAKLDETIGSLHELATTLSSNADSLDSMMRDMGEAAGKIPGVIDRLDTTAVSLERMGDSLAIAGEAVTATMRDTQAEVRHVSQQVTPDAVAVLAELRMVASALERFVADLERDPALLIYGRRAPARGPGE